ncbi:MAG: hypothetical protein M3O86_06200 [Actinomycetota bacterium]|nr:hypothetical protein [Actinomycetota bacterium]
MRSLPSRRAEAQADAEVDRDLPEWLMRAFPAPGQETTAIRAIQVRHNAVSPDEGIRPILDGVDVTTYATSGRGRLEYDVDQAASPVDLKPGMHRAALNYLRVSPESELDPAQREVLDAYTWEFEIS